MSPILPRPHEMKRSARWRVGALFVSYVACFWIVRLVFLTLITFTVMHTRDTGVASPLQRISDMAKANQVLTYGLSATVFALLLHVLNPLTSTRLSVIVPFAEVRKHASGYFLRGVILSLVVILATALGGHLRYLGLYMNFDEVVLNLSSAFLYALAFFSLILVEEYIFRVALEPLFQSVFGMRGALVLSSALYLGLKYFQFDLGWITAINMVLLNILLSKTAQETKSHIASSWLAAGYYLTIHILFGLPFMSQDTPGIFLLRAAPSASARSTADEFLHQAISGGLDGPEAGAVLSLLLLVFFILPRLRTAKSFQKK